MPLGRAVTRPRQSHFLQERVQRQRVKEIEREKCNENGKVNFRNEGNGTGIWRGPGKRLERNFKTVGLDEEIGRGVEEQEQYGETEHTGDKLAQIFCAYS